MMRVLTEGETNLLKDITPEQRSDNTMFYDLEEHRYILDPDYVKTKRAVDLEQKLGSETDAKAFLDEISEKLYAYMKLQTREENYKVTEYRLANQEKYRLHMRRILLAMVMYALRSDGDLVGDQTGINLSKERSLPFAKLRGKIEVSGHVENMLLDMEYKLMYRGAFVGLHINVNDYRGDY